MPNYAALKILVIVNDTIELINPSPQHMRTTIEYQNQKTLMNTETNLGWVRVYIKENKGVAFLTV